MIKPWLPHQDNFLRENFGNFRVVDLAKSLGKTSNAINQRARTLGLVEQQDKSINQGRMHSPQGNPKTAEHIRFEHWLKMQPCQVKGCGKMAEEAHHAPFLSQGGTHDRRVGLCKSHHNERPSGVHHMSREKGDILMGCDVLELAADNWVRFSCE